MDGIVKRVVIVVSAAVALAVVAWMLWGGGGEPTIDDIAGVYRIDPLPSIGGSEPDDFALMFQEGLESFELRLNPDGSYAWSMDVRDLPGGLWEIDGDRVVLTPGNALNKNHRSDVLLIRDGTLVLEADERLSHMAGHLHFVLRKQ